MPVTELAVNLDDTTPEIIGDAAQRLLEAGALDVWTQPIQMKKQRPGVMLCLLCCEEDRDRLAKLTLVLTGSFGVRTRQWDRLELDREIKDLPTPIGPIPFKLGSLDGKVIVATPEYEAVQRAAESHSIPLREAMDIAKAAAGVKGDAS